MTYTIALDTNVLWDFARHRDYKRMDEGTANSLRAVERDLRWLQNIAHVHVVSPLATSIEYLNLVRDDYLSTHLMTTFGLPPREVAKFRKTYKQMKGRLRQEFVSDSRRHLSIMSWISMKFEIPVNKAFGDVTRRLVEESPLGIEDAYVFASALCHDVDCFVTNDNDFHENEATLIDIVGRQILFIDQRKFARDDRQEITKFPTPMAKSRPARAKLISRVFANPRGALGGFFLGRVFQMARGASERNVLTYTHESHERSLNRECRLAIVGQSYYRRLSVNRLEVNGKEVDEVVAESAGKPVRVGVDVTPQQGAIWDPSEPSVEDAVFVEPPDEPKLRVDV